ncbi:phage baseplate assembly protein J, putative [Campylobacter iguaniorum]|uniref:baseplate J/gp47 family protein n=1 Tax=Campylobacter iguaniorum TaxID=1244531 RepID=UPI00073A0765|nr:baseplate J/gp47 family protein [Campylobacter iguaniorum]ALV25047.1 phage baseplate assembly protein J, putative [Campylobacter iguaniorum]
MININSLGKLQVLNELEYETILQNNLEEFKSLVPDYTPFESDEVMIMLEALSYRELNLRAYFNHKALSFFLSTCTGVDLDHYAVMYGLERLKGSKPYASYEFSISKALSVDIAIPKGLRLVDKTGVYSGILLSDVTIKATTTKANGTVELQTNINKSSVKTTLITTSLPYLIEAKELSEFMGGSFDESDESLRKRILISLADTSAAGSIESYKSYTLKADERIEDIKVVNGGAGVVQVYYYSSSADELMLERITKSLNAKAVRPLTDLVKINEASKVNFDINAELKIYPDQETSLIWQNAKQSLNLGLESIKKIGEDITLSEINNFLKVDGVKEVIITSPSSSVVIEDSQIGLANEINITYSII